MKTEANLEVTGDCENERPIVFVRVRTQAVAGWVRTQKIQVGRATSDFLCILGHA